MNQYIFYLFHKGDPSVGINDANTKVAVTSDFQCDNDEFKEGLADMFEIPVTDVLTQAEFDEQQRLDREYEKQMDRAEEELRMEIEKHENDLHNREDDNYTFI